MHVIIVNAADPGVLQQELNKKIKYYGIFASEIVNIKLSESMSETSYSYTVMLVIKD